MHLTPEALARTYDSLRAFSPITSWKLPPSHAIEFRVVRVRGLHGKASHSPFVIAISELCVGHYNTLVQTLAHEMVHIKLFLDGHKRWDRHYTSAFQRHAARVCREMGWDALAF